MQNGLKRPDGCPNPLLTEPFQRDVRHRIELTVSCHDCDHLPKVDNAGQIVIEHGECVQIMHNGLRVRAYGYHGEWMAEIIARLRGHHEPQEELVFYAVMELLPARATMLELGGFWSYYSLWFLHQNGDRRSIVVEPDPSNLAVGRANARLNGLDIEFHQGSIGAEALSEHNFQSEASGLIKVPQFTVSQILHECRIGQLDLLHCDAQGAETAVIRSCMGLLKARRIRFCVISTHSHHISGDPLTHQRCLTLLKQAGGQILAEHDVHESFSGDGLIAAYFGERPLAWVPPKLSYNRYSTSLFRNPLFDLDEILRKVNS